MLRRDTEQEEQDHNGRGTSDKGIAEDVESGKVEMSWSSKRRAQYFQSKYDWDILAARNIWSFGPELRGPNVLIDDTLSAEVNKKLFRSVKSHIVQGFVDAERASA